MWAGALLVGGVVAGELTARWVLGLGDPPIYRLDAEIEYELEPSRTYRRFGNTFSVNAMGMRSREFSATRSGPGELRVLLVGDSIVNGGARVDQGDLATEKLRSLLLASHTGGVEVGNLSAGSWGPVNQLAAVRRHGLMDASVLLIVLNSGDVDDVPGLEPIGPQWPTRSPMLALQELISNYVPRAVARVWPASVPVARSESQRQQDVQRSRAAFRELVELARSRGVGVGLIQHVSASEVESKPDTREETITGWAREMDVPVWSMRPALQAMGSAGGGGGWEQAYLPGDRVHLSAEGQGVLAKILKEATDALLPKTGKEIP